MKEGNQLRHLISIVIFVAGVYAKANLLAMLLLIFIIEELW